MVMTTCDAAMTIETNPAITGNRLIHWIILSIVHTIAEMPEFTRAATGVLDVGEIKLLIDFLAQKPRAGALIRGTGGIRKLRWAREGMGKSGGARVIYYYHDEHIPLYLLTVFGKNAKANLSKGEANELSKLVKLLVRASGV
jgi:RelE toxin of RelE / RelB toxin-antitoxin system